jgi:Flp pilus assembly protein TadD
MLRKIRLLLVVLALPVLPALAQDDREPPEEARKQYAAGLKEASALVQEHQYDRAQERLDVLLATRPREPRARFLKGVVETEQGRTDAAMVVFRALIEDYPELPEPYNNLAVILARRGEFEGARTALETAIRTAPEWSVPHENLGDIYARLAAVEYARAAKLDRTNKTAPAKLVLVRDLLAAAAPPKPKS